PVRVRSSEGLAAMERRPPGTTTAIASNIPVSDAQSSLVFPQAVIGGGYTSTLVVVNVGRGTTIETVFFGTSSRNIRLCSIGTTPANITIDVYPDDEGTPKSATVNVSANQQLSGLISELVAAAAGQAGGYIRIHSDQPIWPCEIYGTDRVLTSGPPL